MGDILVFQARSVRKSDRQLLPEGARGVSSRVKKMAEPDLRQALPFFRADPE
ncbi:hypothetical protein IMCC9480_55 [Oxalobacteraceae bacterium IMCC9480]|nr:hypothetical protein IMCC9480_55 [Oxalobacteraceae bacterium IMCC9480]